MHEKMSYEQICQIIKESDDVVSALEAVGAVYGIPAENITCDDTLKSIKVIGDNISAPPLKNTEGNTKAIICSIGGVLDYISQRIDDKLNDYQRNNIAVSKDLMAKSRTVDPSRGNVLGRYRDANGDEIIAYDTGYIDSANTPEARKKIEEISQQLNLTTYDPKPITTPTYFNDEDDITKDIDIVDNMTANAIEPVDISSDIQESALHIELVSKYNDTRHLGYDIFSEMGFKDIKPIEIIQESKSESESKKDKDKTINPQDIRHMKFDNTNIIKAIKYMNEARQEQADEERGKFSVKLLINNDKWQKAIDCLNKQFDARINIRFINDPEEYSSLYTLTWFDIKTKMTISKSKGFQLHGLPIDIFVINKSIDEEMPKKDPSMFGQFVIAGLLHEIFHNIAAVMREESITSELAIVSTINLAASKESSKERRVIITKFVKSMDKMNGNKLGIIGRRKLIKQLLVATAAQYDELLLAELKRKIDDTDEMTDAEIDQLIEQYEKIIKKREKVRKSTKRKTYMLTQLLKLFIGLLLCCTVVLIPVGIMLFISMGMEGYTDKDIERFRSTKHMEEYYCDLFAAMYQLPLALLIGNPMERSFTANAINPDKLKKLASLEKQFAELVCSEHPTISERTYSAVKTAKTLLENEDIDPAIREYCEWIIENHDSILDTNIANDYNDNTFDPKAAEDLDEHLQTIINNNNVTLTEYDMSIIFSTGDIINE